MGVKVSLFDVTVLEKPTELGKYVIRHRGTEPPALSEQKAVLFGHDRNLMIPVTVAKADGEPLAWGTPVWQGAYIFTVSPETGILFRGGVTHLGSGKVPDWSNSASWVGRALYIGEILYTISPSAVKMVSLVDLHETKS